ncbi:MAG: hypothetical protein K2O66_00145, partial [Bacteroidales bacterium]|nr:hypothetical protein [Bacteroidales bacterium]
MEEKDLELCRFIFKKDALKRQVAANALASFTMLKEESRGFLENFTQLKNEQYAASPINLRYSDKGEMEFSLSFSSDVLMFSLHSNVFEFSRNHAVMQTPYVKEDKERSYCGVIHIYNFLADSIEYGRENDLGYLIGRVFINKENHYFIEGKQELGLFYTGFGSSVFDRQAAGKLLRDAMRYSANFDLLTPPYDEIKDVTVGDVQEEWAYKKMT